MKIVGANPCALLRSREAALVFAAAFLLPSAARAQKPCTCPDMFDLVDRKARAEAAIDAYEAELAGWRAGSTPPARESLRLDLQSRVESKMGGSPKANKASADTDPTCATQNYASTDCLKEGIEQHERVHRAACTAYRDANPLSLVDRWSTLADYASEEIQGYEAELIYINASLESLERECRFTLEFRSTIRGTPELAESKAETDVDLAMSLPRGLAPKGLSGTSRLKYNTRDVGPPKVVGPSPLADLIGVCWATFEGKGDNVPFRVIDGWIRRQTRAPYEPLVELTVSTGETRETRKLKGPRPCRAPDQVRSFWSDRFIRGKTGGAPGYVLIDDWTFPTGTGVFAEKTIRSTCAGPSATTPTCAETTTLKLRQKP